MGSWNSAGVGWYSGAKGRDFSHGRISGDGSVAVAPAAAIVEKESGIFHLKTFIPVKKKIAKKREKINNKRKKKKRI